MYIQLPNNLVFANSQLNISFAQNADFNKTNNSMLIEGTRGGFLSLSNGLTYFSNDLQEEIPLHQISFITSEIEFIIQLNDALDITPYGRIERENDNKFVWLISESELCRVASEIHSLGHINNELHFDENKSSNEISVYCVVS